MVEYNALNHQQVFWTLLKCQWCNRTVTGGWGKKATRSIATVKPCIEGLSTGVTPLVSSTNEWVPLWEKDMRVMLHFSNFWHVRIVTLHPSICGTCDQMAIQMDGGNQYWVNCNLLLRPGYPREERWVRSHRCRMILSPGVMKPVIPWTSHRRISKRNRNLRNTW